MKHNAEITGWSRRYQTAFSLYLMQGTTASLQPALKLGRQALAFGLGARDVALIHEKALLAQVLPGDMPAASCRILKRAAGFLAEAMLPLVITHRGVLDANARLSHENRSLNCLTSDLAVSNRRLQKEIARRMVVEETLRNSERHSALMAEQLRLLSRRMLSVQEEERKRISRELHDVIAQLLTGITVRLANLKLEAAAANTRDLSQKISRTQRLVEKSVDIVHRFARELRPAMLDDLGLIPALHSFLNNFSKETGLRVSLTAFSGVEELSKAKRTVLYRVAQEALTNVTRHAQQARSVDVNIQRHPKAVRMQIKDDGNSFDVDKMWRDRKSQHLGLLGMRERLEMVGGKLTVYSAPGEGTTLDAEIPFRQHAIVEKSRA